MKFFVDRTIQVRSFFWKSKVSRQRRNSLILFVIDNEYGAITLKSTQEKYIF